MKVSGCLPDGIDLTAVNKIVSRCGVKSFKVIEVKRETSGDKSGDHYLSEIINFSIRIETGGSEKTYAFVVKDMSKGLSDFIVEINGIEKEVSLYADIMPHVTILLGESITPEMYYQTSNRSIVLSDLSPRGYKLADRMSLLDFDHCKCALICLAKFHAGSLMYHENSPNAFRIVGEETVFTGNKDQIYYYFAVNNIKNVLRILKDVPAGEQFIDSVQKFSQTFWEEANRVIAEEYEVRVLNHGDFWTTNFLYLYDNEKRILDCKLIDFQMTRMFAPSLDIYQFIALSMKPSVRDNHLDELLEVYVETFNRVLTSLGSKIRLSKAYMDKMMEETKVFGIMCSLLLPAIALCDPNDPLPLSDVTKSDFRNGFPRGDPYAKAYNQLPVKEHIISLLQFYRRKGFI